MFKCEICDREFKSKLGLGKHLKSHNITLQNYYDRYLEGKTYCKNCGGETKFISLNDGYSQFCSIACVYKFRTGKKRFLKEKPINTVTCQICGQGLVSTKALSQHIINHDITSKEYYDTYINDEGICKHCNKITKFKNIDHGYQDYCGLKCSNSDEDKRNKSKIRMVEYWESDKAEETKIKISNTVKKLWNDENSIYHDKKYRESLGIGQRKRYIEYRKIFYKTISEQTNFELLGEYQNATEEILIKCKDCGYEFYTIWNYLLYRKSCPKCKPNGKSSYETEIADFIKSILINIEIIENDTSIVKSLHSNRYLELDIYIPDKKFAIEFDGLHWHSTEKLLDKNYHLYKTQECEKQDIQLIHIFEDEWLHKQEIVKNRLKQILGVNTSERIHARKCIIKEIEPKVKNEFLEKYHIQGKDASTIKLGAFYEEKLISAMTFSKGNISKGSKVQDKVWELNRFCSNSNYHIPGIAGKLLTHFKKNYEWIKIYSYADRRWSQGHLYYKLDFKLDYITKINYWYIRGSKRIHRFNLRKRPDEPKDITEKVLRKAEGYDRIWDCGNLKFKMLNKEFSYI